jgi:hypothetical protein
MIINLKNKMLLDAVNVGLVDKLQLAGLVVGVYYLCYILDELSNF